jgi:hypothetical protein
MNGSHVSDSDEGNTSVFSLKVDSSFFVGALGAKHFHP